MTKTKTELQLKEMIAKASGEKGEINLEHPADKNFGDYSTNIAMLLAKKEGENPREVATEMVHKIKNEANDLIENVDIAGPGFINFFLKKEFLKKEAEIVNFEIEFKKRLSEYGKGQTVIIDYSAPNIAKPFGIGHLRSTNIGQALYNIYKILGWKTIGDNHLGDWGTQFGKLIYALKRWANKPVEEMSIEDLEKLYVRFHSEAKLDEKLDDEGRAWFAKLENGDPEAREIWTKCIEISKKEFDRVYELLDVKIDYALGESFYLDKMNAVIEEMDKMGIIKESQGARIVEFEKMPPVIVQKSNRTTTYLTRDLATIKYRLDTWKADLVIYEVGVDQELYFRQLFEIAKMLGWLPSQGFKHIGHGLIRWKTGKFSTRQGDTIHLADVIENATEKAIAIAEHTAVAKDLSATEREEMIKAVAIGAIKFNDLSQDPKKDIIFDWDQIMSLEGDSGPYLQYAYARCQSVLSKSKIKEQKDIESVPEILSPEEEKMLRIFYLFEEKIIDAAISFNPSIIATYLLEVARTYNEFYAKNKIIGDKNEIFRIFLTKSTTSVIHMGLQLLGIKTLERM